MTNDFRSGVVFPDQQIVGVLLAETAMNRTSGSGLKSALIHVRSLAQGPQLTPQGEPAAFLEPLTTGPEADTDTVSSLEAHRRNVNAPTPASVPGQPTLPGKAVPSGSAAKRRR